MLAVLVRSEAGAVEQLRFLKGMGDRWGTPLPMSTTQLKRKVCVSEHFRVVTATELLPENTLLLERGIPVQSYRPDGFNILTPTASLRGKDRSAIIALLEKKSTLSSRNRTERVIV
ncbi:hypothetical protein TNCT_309831 [Trichonephila clavata]|uniref:Uncharacterized protein n=1 Tax=Trichonephila clavata TaxID=2740835 RepID=A0A8X6FQJ4_TRICU|nr:hypothetical protein TNCT_309831 [Trichonephila clavata]